MWRVSRKRREHHIIPFPLSLSHRPGLTSGYKRFLLPRLGGYTWREKSFLLIAGKHSLGTLSCLARWASLVKRICPKGTNFQDYCVIVIVISPFYSLSFPSLSWPSSPSKWLNAGRREKGTRKRNDYSPSCRLNRIFYEISNSERWVQRCDWLRVVNRLFPSLETCPSCR